MSRKDGTGRKSGSVGSFFFGSFIGFILCLAAIVGIGCFAYFKVSPAWINKHFKTNIDLGNDEVNNKTINNFVSSAISLAQNVDTYTLADLKDDFGIEIEDNLFGIDITDLKTVGISDLPQAIEDKFANISADELRDVMSLDDMASILDKHNVYYYNSEDNKLYKEYNGTYSSEIEFDYSLNEDKSKVITKGHETAITLNADYGVMNQVNIPLWYLPLTDALSDFTANMGDQITLADLENDFGVDLPSFFDNVDKQNTTVNELEDAINDMHVADFLGYTIDNTDPDNPVVYDGSTEVTGVIATLAKLQISGLERGIEELALEDVFTEDDLSTGALSLIDKTTLLTDIATTMNEKFKTVTIGELIDNKVIELDTADMAQYSEKKDKYVAGTNTKLKDLKLNEMTSILFDSIPVSDTPAS